MVTFIVRRLIATVFLLVVVSMVTYAVFFLIPRLAGQNSYQLATQYVGRNPTRAAVLDIEQKLGLNEPLWVQYGRFIRGLGLRRALQLRDQFDLLPAAVLRLLLQVPAGRSGR